MYTSKVTGQANFNNIKSQQVYLPAGHTWFDFWKGDKIKGGQLIKKESPIDIIPLYVKAGSIIPMGPFQQYSGEKNMKNIELRVYPGADGTFTLYEDENDNYDYEKGVYSTIKFIWNDKENTLTIGSRKGNYPGMLNKRTFSLVLVNENHGVGAGITQPDKMIMYNGLKKVVRF
jgi:alpha-D-xyloside xylohydrolase